MNFDVAAKAFAAVGAPQRLMILRALVRAGSTGLSVGALQAKMDMPGATLNHHLKAMVAARLIVQEKHGRTIINQADFDVVKALSAFLIEHCCLDQAVLGTANNNQPEQETHHVG